ncbi:2OG-Fe dioxygenase family protein [Streptomyces solicathayae]|uniref:2OG-Fe dioxygenase family protein n=1 Tax=Streptomyces solicathayae TaxID=3081768 RepID=A0ABZ0LQ28_9ACTN|nr:2OG-Fe dioxygenase family protein [Streptomyces sp. HUAS YS2]WOX21572.1 2OG-Fe dioxygenase family protein [Streptomyces sp. HUAS YS2]
MPEPSMPEPSMSAPSTSAPYVHLSATDVLESVAAYGEYGETEIKQLRQSWDGLPVDRFMKGGASYRRRRYSEFQLTDRGLVRAPHGAFRQSLAVNPLHGGVAREFEPVEQEVAESPLLTALVRTLLARLPGSFDSATGGIGIHQIRIVASREAEGLPAPEGIHEDGHHFVAQVLLRRENVEGGVSQVYDREKNPLFRTLLTEPFETVVIDDRRVFHGVSAVEVAEGTPVGVRDMMLVDFFPRRAEQDASDHPESR